MNTVTTFKTLLKTTAMVGLLFGPQLAASEAQARDAGNYVSTTGDALATDNQTAYSGSLFCLADTAHRRGWTAPRMAVGRIADMTGKSNIDEGAKITQGASLFAITALGKAGLPVVERLDSSVSEIELNYAKQHLLSDTPERAGIDPNNYRKTLAGQIAGSGYYIVGGVTELNNNIKSSGFQLVGSSAASNPLNPAGQGQITNRNYVLNVGVDLRLVNSTTQEVVKTVSFQKQIIGHENEGALGGSKSRKILGLTGGVSAIEPIQAGVRALIELGVYQLADFVYTGENGSGCMSDTSRKYAALDTVRPVYNPPVYNPPVYDEPRPMVRQVEPAYVRPTYNPPAYDNRDIAPTYAPPQPQPQYRDSYSSQSQYQSQYQGRYDEPVPPVYQAPQSQYPGAYQGQVPPLYVPPQEDLPRYAPQQYAPQYQDQYQEQYQQPYQGQPQDLPRYLRDSWRR